MSSDVWIDSFSNKICPLEYYCVEERYHFISEIWAVNFIVMYKNTWGIFGNFLE